MRREEIVNGCNARRDSAFPLRAGFETVHEEHELSTAREELAALLSQPADVEPVELAILRARHLYTVEMRAARQRWSIHEARHLASVLISAPVRQAPRAAGHALGVLLRQHEVHAPAIYLRGELARDSAILCMRNTRTPLRGDSPMTLAELRVLDGQLLVAITSRNQRLENALWNRRDALITKWRATIELPRGE